MDSNIRPGKKSTNNGNEMFPQDSGNILQRPISNDEVRDKVRQEIGPNTELLNSVKTRKLKWYGHTTRTPGLANTILHGAVAGGRKRGRQRKRWEDNITEWTGLTPGVTTRKAEDRDEWWKLIARCVKCPSGQPTKG